MRNYTHLKLNNILLNKIKSHKLTIWLEKKLKYYHDYQILSYKAVSEKKDVLINAPTGSGKTIAAFMAPIINFNQDIRTGLFTTLYISPLKSLINDINRSLNDCVKGAELSISIEARTGDTSNYRRQAQLKKPPNFLITTPESFALMMSYENTNKFFSNIKYIIIDELHSLIYSKRGDLLTLNLARLSCMAPNAVKIGLSATIKDTNNALNYFSNSNNKKCIEPRIKKKISIKVLNSNNAVPWSGHMPTYAIKDIYSFINSNKSTIIFVNTRAQCEYLFQNLWKVNKAKLKIAIHHGSLAKNIRFNIEKKMFKGLLNCIVATSSLELGIDWDKVDLVIQIGAPKGISRIIQRVGRSNHEIDKVSKAVLVPTNKFEYLECLAAKEALKNNIFENTEEKTGSLDVLAQHINGVACSNSFKPIDLYNNILKAWPYRKLTRKKFDSVLNFVHNGGYVLKNYNLFSRLKKHNDLYSISNKSFIRKYRMNVGTIVESEMMPVYLKNKKLGLIEDYFINQLQKKDTFLFAGQIFSLDKFTSKGAEVRLSKSKSPKIPSYVGGNLPLSTYLAEAVIKLIQNFEFHIFPDEIKNWIMAQKKLSSLPPKNGLLIETFNRKKVYYIVCYTFLGRGENQTLGMLIMKRLEKFNCQPLAFTATDYTIAVWSVKEFKDIYKLFNNELLDKELNAWLNNTSIIKKHFKKVAIISGLIDKNLPGKTKSHKQANFSSDIIYDVLEKYEKNHILINITKDEALRELVGFYKLKKFINKIKSKVTHNKLKKISPFAIPIVMQFYTEKISKEKLISYTEENIEQAIIKEAYKID
ncbi:ligase-associated DNA damage response DEXH box helicase [Alphaproteobacteria bacterium]|nr:ligase-associated DNA damage response DEXH box helicase [Alphaproteobacteria bacterium]